MFLFPAARCLDPPSLLYPRPACRRTPALTTVVSAKPRRWTQGSRRDRDREWDDGGGSNSDVDDGFFRPEQQDDEDEPTPPSSHGRPGSTPPAPQLRGSDVLRALQKAAAAKEAARSKRQQPAARQRQGKEKLKLEGGGDKEALEVRPVVIRPEWAARIRELELRVQQLAADNYRRKSQ